MIWICNLDYFIIKLFQKKLSFNFYKCFQKMLSSRVSRFFLSNVTPPDVTRRELWLNDVLIYVIYIMPATVCEYYLLMSNNLLFVDHVLDLGVQNVDLTTDVITEVDNLCRQGFHGVSHVGKGSSHWTYAC